MNDNERDFPEFYEFALYIIFAIFLKIPWKIWNSSLGWIRQIQRIILVIIFLFFLKNSNFGLKMKVSGAFGNLNLSEINSIF